MTVFICRSGLLRILLVLFGALAGYAAPLPDREGTTTNQATHEVFSACKDMAISAYAVKMVPWQETCRPTLSTHARSEVGFQHYHPDFVWGDMFSQSQLTDDSLQCLSNTSTGKSDLKKICNIMGMPWINTVTGIPTLSETFQSLYEFDLPEREFQKDAVSGLALSYQSRQFLTYGGTVSSDWSRILAASNMSSSMQLLPLQDQNLRNLAFWDSGYQLEVSDTVTRFIPKLAIHTRSLELGDLVALLLFLLLLPDYKKLRSLFTNVWESHRL